MDGWVFESRFQRILSEVRLGGVKMKKATKEHGGDDEGGMYAYNADVVNETYAEH